MKLFFEFVVVAAGLLFILNITGWVCDQIRKTVRCPGCGMDGAVCADAGGLGGDGSIILCRSCYNVFERQSEGVMVIFHFVWPFLLEEWETTGQTPEEFEKIRASVALMSSV